MKKWIAIFFLFIFLSANTVFGEVLRLPVLAHHYLEHVTWDNNKSLFDFLAKHYAAKINHPDDQHHDHQRLPFKSMDCFALQVVITAPQSFFALSKIILVASEEKNILPDQQYYSSTVLSSIWQPPRFS
ncbi:MAG: hypothetical protein QM802_08830 [Agriterribacter sp.]